MKNESLVWEAPQLIVEDVFATLGGASTSSVESGTGFYAPTSGPVG
jgi:hypothetical protein